eukprot:6383204-Amphidinium_carterae.2
MELVCFRNSVMKRQISLMCKEQAGHFEANSSHNPSLHQLLPPKNVCVDKTINVHVALFRKAQFKLESILEAPFGRLNEKGEFPNKTHNTQN